MFAKRPWLAALLLTLSGPLIFGLCYGFGRLFDCAPHQMDGQCGLMTGLGMLAGAVIGGAISSFSLLWLFLFGITAAWKKASKQKAV